MVSICLHCISEVNQETHSSFQNKDSHKARLEICIFTESDGRKGPPAGNKLGAIAHTRHKSRVSNTMRSRTKTQNPKPNHGRKRSLSRGPGKTAHRGPARGLRRDACARLTQGRVALAMGNAELPEYPRDEGGPREARPASLHPLDTRGRTEDTCRYVCHLEASRAAAANPGQVSIVTEARQPETKLGAIAYTHHKARLRNAKRTQTKTPNAQTRRKAGLTHLSRGPGKAAQVTLCCDTESSVCTWGASYGA
jgi:hypothetical protein